jgi:hypothetical protein
MKKIFTAGLTALVLASASAESTQGRASSVGTLAHRGAESTGKFVDIPPVTVSGLAGIKGLVTEMAAQDGVRAEVVYKGVPGATIDAPVVAEDKED